MKTLFTLLTLLTLSVPAVAAEGGLPLCKAELNDEFNTPVGRLEWNQGLFMGSMNTPTQKILISTSVGNNQVMSLWVREDKDSPNGMFSFVDLSSGHDQYLRFYMSDKYSLGVTCTWQP